MEYKLLEKADVILMANFKDDENTSYNEKEINEFLKEKNSYAFICKNSNEILGFAYGYVLLRPDGKKDFYLHAIDVMQEHQGNGYGTKLMNFIKEYMKKLGCRKIFLITNKSNISACKCYEKSGGINSADDEIVYVYK